MNNIVAGLGDVLLRYPELIEDLTVDDRAALDALPRRYVAVHLAASSPVKVPPRPTTLLEMFKVAGVPHVVVGCEGWGTKPKLRVHMEIVRRATKFVGTLSCFNVLAQLAKVPSFVLVNRAIKEPFVYGLMHANGARVEAWNVGKSAEAIYSEVIDWCEDVQPHARFYADDKAPSAP